MSRKACGSSTNGFTKIGMQPKPRSITAYVAQADFLTDYAWHARGTGYSNKVTKEGWRLFAERLAKARESLEKSMNFEPKCPMWWRVCITLARGQGWSRDDFEKLFQAAKAFEPQFWGYDVAKGRISFAAMVRSAWGMGIYPYV